MVLHAFVFCYAVDGRNINGILAVPREKAMEIEKEAQKKVNHTLTI